MCFNLFLEQRIRATFHEKVVHHLFFAARYTGFSIDVKGCPKHTANTYRLTSLFLEMQDIYWIEVNM